MTRLLEITKHIVTSLFVLIPVVEALIGPGKGEEKKNQVLSTIFEKLLPSWNLSVKPPIEVILRGIVSIAIDIIVFYFNKTDFFDKSMPQPSSPT